jgi:hypothetical protein
VHAGIVAKNLVKLEGGGGPWRDAMQAAKGGRDLVRLLKVVASLQTPKPWLPGSKMLRLEIKLMKYYCTFD